MHPNLNHIWIPSEEDRRLLMLYAMGTLHLQRQDAEDVVQDAMRKYWEFFTTHNVHLQKAPKAYLYTTLKNAFIDKKRKAKRYAILEDEFRKTIIHLKDFIDTHVSVELVEKTAENFIKSLPPVISQVIQLSVDGKTSKEIAEATHLPIHRVNNILRSDRDLGKILKRLMAEQPF